MTEPRLTTVIVTYQSAETLGASMEAARRCFEAGISHSIYVDNASQDGTRQLLRSAKSWGRVVCLDKNYGFGQGCNCGLALVKTPYTLFLNPDAQLEPEAAVKLIRFMDRTPKAGVCGPAIIEGPDAVLQTTGKRFTPSQLIRRVVGLGRGNQDVPIVPGTPPFPCEWVCGAAMMVRTELLKSIGGFDARFFLYFEEMDVCLRVATAGWEIWATGESVVSHVGGASSHSEPARIGGCIAKHYYESRYYYMRKHYGWRMAVLAEIADCILLGKQVMFDLAGGRGWHALIPRLQTRMFRIPNLSE